MSALYRYDQHDKEMQQQEDDWGAWQRAGQRAEIEGRVGCLTRAEMDTLQWIYFEQYRALRRQYGSTHDITY